jgi:Leucine-rich repeat (LRR) protein
MPNLLALRINSNQLSSLAANVFNSSINLRFLYLYNNNLTYLDPNIFQPLKNIVTIDLSRNQLNQTRNNFNLTGLNSLSNFYI